MFRVSKENPAKLLLSLLAVLLVVAACKAPVSSEGAELEVEPPGQEQPVDSAPPEIVTLVPEVIASYPHDPQAFTQGLEFYEGSFLESTGLYGESSLRKVAPETGEVLALQMLPAQYFGEGLTRVGSELIQLTWRAQLARKYDLDSLRYTGTFSYASVDPEVVNEGWGLCYNGSELVMSDGSSTLSLRDPETFELRSRVQVKATELPAGGTLENLNELECVGTTVYANIWGSNDILRIELPGGYVSGVIDASILSDSFDEAATARLAADPNAVLNGIAYGANEEVFYLTGKRWPTLFKVRLVERVE